MAKQIVIDSGELYEIVNKQGEKIGEFVFYPTDVGLVERYEKVIDTLKKLQLDDVSKLSVASSTVKEQLDYLFNADVSNTLFSKLNPFSPMANGEMYMETVVNTLGKIIEKEMNVNTEKLKKRIDKYTSKYTK